MRIRVLSDLHIDIGGQVAPPPCNEDLVILAGDVCEGLAGVAWADRVFRGRPVVYVPGNHEFYGSEHASFRAALREAIDRTGGHVVLLDDDAMTIGGLRIIGSTLWTDFELYGSAPPRIAEAKAVCRRMLLDFRHIHIAREDGRTRLIEPDDTVVWHRRARQYLGLALASGDPASTIVVTHHGPHRKSLAPRFADDLTSAAFISALGPLLSRAALWVHGHTHTSFDYTVGTTRVVCNPRGYCRSDGSDCENPDFRWDYVVDVES